jgi:hypothetical protein
MKTKVLQNRIEEIKELNRSNMTRSEKKKLRKEFRELKQEIDGNNREVFISVGSLVIIALILILFL